MKQKYILFLLLFLIISAVLISFFYKFLKYKVLPVSSSMDASYLFCESDSDCEKTKDSYCSCSESGKATAINRKHTNKWLETINKSDSHFCLLLPSINEDCKQEAIAKCVNSQCRLVIKRFSFLN